MGSHLPIFALALFVALSLFHSVVLEEPSAKAEDKAPVTPEASTPTRRSSSGTPPNPPSKPKEKGEAPGQKKGVGKGYGSRNYDDGYHGDSYEDNNNQYGSNSYGHDSYNNNNHYGHGYGHQHDHGYGGGYEKNDGYGSSTYGHDNYNNHHKHGYGKSVEYGPFQYDNSYGHSYDTHYCSVHGSFSLALTRDYGHNDYGKKDSYGKKDEYASSQDSYGEKSDYGDKDDYGVDSYGKSGYGKKSYSYKPRFHTRQYCRYAAAASERACKFCCRVVARSSNTSPDDIVSAIFNFDPVEPTAHGAGLSSYGNGGDYNKDYGKDDSYGKGYGKSAYQCVCCAPKHDNYYKKK